MGFPMMVTLGQQYNVGERRTVILLVGVGKRGEYQLVQGDMPRQHSFGTTLRFTGPVPADSR